MERKKEREDFQITPDFRILYLLPDDSAEKGGMIQMTKIFKAAGLFDNSNIYWFNTFFKSEESVVKRSIESLWHKIRFIKVLIHVRPKAIFVLTSAFWGFFDKIIYCLIAKVFGIKTVLNSVGGFAEFYESNQLKARIIRYCMRIPDVIATGSNFWCRYFEKNFPGVHLEKIANPVDISRFYKNEEKTNTVLRVVTISGIIEEKGIRELVEVIKSVNLRSSGFQFSIMGGGSLLSFVKDSLSDEIRSGKVDVPGYVTEEEKISAFANAHVFIMLSYDEVIPISMLEAMSASLPVLTTEVGGIADIVRSGENGFLFVSKTVEPVVDQLLLLEGKYELLDRMGKISKQITEQGYDVNQVLTEHFRVIQELVKK